MINDELLSKFERIKDLPVSEEMLGAYAEGNVTDSEQMLISTIADSSSEISTLLSDVEEWKGVFESDLHDFNQIDVVAVPVNNLPNIDDFLFSNNYEDTSFGLESIGAEILDPFDGSSIDSLFSSDISPLGNDNLSIDGDSFKQEEHSLDTNSDSDGDIDFESDGSDFNNLDF